VLVGRCWPSAGEREKGEERAIVGRGKRMSPMLISYLFSFSFSRISIRSLEMNLNSNLVVSF
jgi:hypothetical protein